MGKEQCIICNQGAEGMWKFMSSSIELWRGESPICCSLAARCPNSLEGEEMPLVHIMPQPFTRGSN
jgi:hypothetical protein